MLRDAGVRTKLLAVLAIPTVLLVLVTGLLVAGQVSEARRAGQVSALAEIAPQVNKVAHGLQAERDATLVHLEAPTQDTRAAMLTARHETDVRVARLRSLVEDTSLDRLPEAVRTALDRSAASHAELAGARRSIDAKRFFATETDVLYSKAIRVDLDLPASIASSGTQELAQNLQAYQALSSSIEYAAHERDLVRVALVSGSLNEAEFAQATAMVAQQRQSLQDVKATADAALYSRLDNGLAGAANYEIDQVRRALPDLLAGTDPDPAAASDWVEAANTRVALMTTAESAIVNDIEEAATATKLGQERRALVLVALAILGLGLALLLAVGLARRITRPLRRLTVAAGEIGAELPHMVERMQTPGEGPGVVVEPIPVESSDEIGQLAAAFNTVNDVTVQVAKEQAALRASIAEMFVNVARRNQVLLGRQLKALDTMEATEEDPDVLQRLFTLDHLATRMRRNAESLLVLAGIDSTRRLRTALPLSDVIRTAVGEIEAYDRIDLSMSLAEDADVSGRHALGLAHLLAELLENATHFSNPETRVIVSAAVTTHGVDVTVSDSGLGMSEEEIAAANLAIAAPPVAEIAVSQRLGMFVVGRLAGRLGATVTLRRGRSAGTVVTTSLPAAIFEGLQVLAPVAPVEAVVEPVVEPVEAAVEQDRGSRTHRRAVRAGRAGRGGRAGRAGQGRIGRGHVAHGRAAQAGCTGRAGRGCRSGRDVAPVEQVEQTQTVEHGPNRRAGRSGRARCTGRAGRSGRAGRAGRIDRTGRRVDPSTDRRTTCRSPRPSTSCRAAPLPVASAGTGRLPRRLCRRARRLRRPLSRRCCPGTRRAIAPAAAAVHQSRTPTPVVAAAPVTEPGNGGPGRVPPAAPSVPAPLFAAPQAPARPAARAPLPVRAQPSAAPTSVPDRLFAPPPAPLVRPAADASPPASDAPVAPLPSRVPFAGPVPADALAAGRPGTDPAGGRPCRCDARPRP